MFTIKLYMDENSYDVLSVPHYNVYRSHQFIEITLYKDFTTSQGVTYRITKEDYNSQGVPHYDYCFIENSSGKTIENLRIH